MDWRSKARIFRVLSRLPFGEQMHYRLQRHVTKEWPRPAVVLDLLLKAARRVLEASGDRPNQFLEIGAGNDLAVAVALRLLGVARITCVDVSRLARPELIAHAAAHIAVRLGVPVPEIRAWTDVERFGITYIAPAHLQRTGLAASSFDCFYSIDTLEHIPPDDLRKVLTESKSLLRPGGRSVHLIDFSDHFARGAELSRFNFLTYSEDAWRPFNSSFQYVNRLRDSQYLRLFEEIGLKVLRHEPDVMPAERPILERLAPEFRGFDVNDLFTTRAMIVATAG